MTYTNNFIVPDYYKHFICKSQDCRHSCCQGWNITISMKEYFNMLGLNCNKQLRKKIDGSFYILNHPTQESYASVVKTNNNDCPMHMANGYCMLHYECGEKALPAICRYFPRGPRISFNIECSCSNSCEKTLELLLSNDEEINFEQLPLTFNLPLSASRVDENVKNQYKKIRDLAFAIMNNRNLPLSERLITIGKVLHWLNKETDNNNIIDFTHVTLDSFIDENLNYEKSPQASYDIQEKLVSFFLNKNTSIQKYASEAIEYYNKGDKVIQYNESSKHLKKLFPNLEIMLEKILVNHLFFDQFPFSNTSETFWEEFESLGGVFLFLIYITTGYMANKNTIEDFIDVVAASFRLITHTDFDRNVGILLHREDVTTLEQLASFIIS